MQLIGGLGVEMNLSDHPLCLTPSPPPLLLPSPTHCTFFGTTTQLAFAVVPLVFVLNLNLPPASAAILVVEQVRLVMKSHAFVRANSVRIFGLHRTSSVSDLCTAAPIITTIHNSVDAAMPSTARGVHAGAAVPVKSTSTPGSWCFFGGLRFSAYVYFMFAPTLVYQDAYPRTPTRRWTYVASNLTQVAACVVYTYYLLARFCIEPFGAFGLRTSLSLAGLLRAAFTCTLPGGLILLIVFFAFLHSWQNAFAELFRFGDRLFYRDWWNSTAFSGWYRTWNVLVHDWLYTYVYRDIRLALADFRHARLVATTAVFLMSALVHEYILTVTFHFFYPVLFVYFGGAGFLFHFVRGKARSWNIALWVALFLGMGQLICLYSLEWYARQNCAPVVQAPWLNFWVPHSWFCTRMANAESSDLAAATAHSMTA